jgi:NTP pyrophosphatase (non-canonical NTP hydrolase)
MDFETLRTAIITHQRERTFVNDKTAVEEIDKLQEEVEELRESLLEAEIGGGATEVAGELADVAIVLLTIADKCGIDILQAMTAKQMRNELKAPKSIVNNGYPEPYGTSKEIYKMAGGDEMFYQAYLLLIAEED